MDAKKEIDEAANKMRAKIAINKVDSFLILYAAIRSHVKAILSAEYVADYEIYYVKRFSKYSGEKLLNLRYQVWGMK